LRAKGLRFDILKASTEGEIDAAFASLAKLQAGGLLVGGDPFFHSQREQLVALAARLPFRRSTTSENSPPRAA
jgi:putative ABC transport system substrate-binding protein